MEQSSKNISFDYKEEIKNLCNNLNENLNLYKGGYTKPEMTKKIVAQYKNLTNVVMEANGGKKKKSLSDNYIQLGNGTLDVKTRCLSEKKDTYNEGKRGMFWKRKTTNSYLVTGTCESCKKNKSNIIGEASVPKNLVPKK